MKRLSGVTTLLAIFALALLARSFGSAIAFCDDGGVVFTGGDPWYLLRRHSSASPTSRTTCASTPASPTRTARPYRGRRSGISRSPLPVTWPGERIGASSSRPPGCRSSPVRPPCFRSTPLAAAPGALPDRGEGSVRAVGHHRVHLGDRTVEVDVSNAQVRSGAHVPVDSAEEAR